MELLFNEQDVVDGACVLVAEREGVNVESVDVDLQFNPSFGFSATAVTFRGTRHLSEQDIIDGIAIYLRDFHNFNPEALSIDLRFDEASGITASIIKQY